MLAERERTRDFRRSPMSALRNLVIIFAAVILTVAVGKKLNGPRAGPTATTAAAQNMLMDAEAFDLGQVVGLIKADKVADAQSLQTTINDPSSGNNNVDLDKDGQIDFIAVHEAQAAGGKKFDFIAYPSSKNG